MADSVDNDVGSAQYIEKSVNDFEADMSEWSSEAWNNFDFIAGRQYTAEEESKLKERLRPVVIFNLLDKFVSSVSGTEIANEMNVRYYPNAITRSGPVEIVNEVIQSLIEDDNDVEHSEAFADALICGYGWLTCYLCEEEGQYNIREARVDPFEMGWDPNAQKQNLADANFIYRKRYMDPAEVEAEWPDKVDELKFSATSSTPARYTQLDDSSDYRGRGIKDYRNRYAVIHFQWRQWARYVKYNAGGEDQSVKESDFSKVKKQLEEMGNLVQKVGVFTKAEYWQTYYCRGILLEDKQQINGFNYFCTTGKRDVVKGYFYGLLRACKDPQRWTNKFFSNLMHTMSTSGQGIFIERSAVNPNDASNFESDYARPDKIKWLADGAVSQGRFKTADQTPLPAGLPQLLDFANNAINNTLGINLEFLGMASRTQSGPVESSRKRAGLNIIARFFQSRRLQMRQLGRCRLDIMQNYVPKEVIEGIVSDLNKPYFQGLSEVYFDKYFVRVDEAPNSADVKTDVWTIIIELIPYLMNVKIPPQFLVTLLKYSPLPTHIVDELWKIVNQPPSPEEQKAKALQLEGLEGQVAETKSKAVLNVAKAKAEGEDLDAVGEVINRLLEIQKANIEMGHEEQKHALEMQKLQANTASTLIKTQAQMALSKQKAKDGSGPNRDSSGRD